MKKSRIVYVLFVSILMTCTTQPPQTKPEGSQLERRKELDSDWTYLGGPIGGLGYDIRFHPKDKNILFVSDARAGVFKSSDGGDTWEPKNRGITARAGDSGDNIPVFCLTIDQTNPDIIWCGTKDQRGIFKTTDGGDTWIKKINGIEEEHGITFRGIYPEPGNPDVVYAAGEISSWAWAKETKLGVMFDRTMGFVYKSVNGGDTWRKIWEGDNLTRYVCIDPQNSDVIYVSTGIFDRDAANSDPDKGLAGGVGILKSVDGGNTWTSLNEKNGLDCLYINSLYMHPENPDILLAGAGHDFYSHPNQVTDRFPSNPNAKPVPGGVYLTRDGGLSWEKTLEVETIEAVEFFDADPTIAYAGNEWAFYRSRDGGLSWENTNLKFGPPFSAWGPEDTVAGFPIDIAIDPDNPDRFFVNNYGGGNFVTEDGGYSWDCTSTGYSGAIVSGGLSIANDKPGKVYAGARSGLFVSFNNGNDWQGTAFPPARLGEINGVGVHPVNSDILLASPWDLGLSIARSSDGGQSWSRVRLPIDRNQQILCITFAPSQPGIVYAGIGQAACRFDMGGTNDPGNGVVKSLDEGVTWKKLEADNIESKTVTAVAVHPKNPDILYAAARQHGLYKSSNGGKSWSEVFKRRSMLFTVQISPFNPDVVAVGTSEGIFISKNGAESWQQKPRGLNAEAKVTSIVFHPSHHDRMFISDLHSGVYSSTDSGETWFPENNSLFNRNVVYLAVSPDGEHLFAATQGAGVFRLDL